MYPGIFACVFIFAIVDWYAVSRNWRGLEYFAKPATLAALLLWFGVVTNLEGPAFWIAAGLFFSLLGDVFLMLPQDLFLAGLAAFLLAHLAYIAGLNQNLVSVHIGGLALGLPVVGIAAVLYRRVSSGVERKQPAQALRIGVSVYSLAITLMLISAVLTLARPEWNLSAALLVALGGIFFFCSDSLLALNRFTTPILRGKLWVIITYHLGQAALAAGFALQMSS
ncbi:MAG: lysoplasmalogenase [Chloroflexi bacterium]|nr:lysoplasmalogenase [Chloroflexota bacterium]